jgi:hypothetical protein
MDIYRLKAAFTDPDHAPHWYLEHSDEHGITLAWLAYPTPEAGWRFEQHDRYRGRMPATATGIPSGAWEDLQAMLQAFAYQRCGIRAPGEPKPAPPAVRWERAPFRWVGPYQWQGPPRGLAPAAGGPAGAVRLGLAVRAGHPEGRAAAAASASRLARPIVGTRPPLGPCGWGRLLFAANRRPLGQHAPSTRGAARSAAVGARPSR